MEFVGWNKYLLKNLNIIPLIHIYSKIVSTYIRISFAENKFYTNVIIDNVNLLNGSVGYTRFPFIFDVTNVKNLKTNNLLVSFSGYSEGTTLFYVNP